MAEYKDIEIRCLCGKDFVWTAGEQVFMNDLLEKKKILTLSQPRRCHECRIQKREHYEKRDAGAQ